MELRLPKGVRDFPPEEKIKRDELLNILKGVFEQYGFNPLETPIFERFKVLSAKYAGGSEILKETFRFTDQGERELALRYDLTVPLARFVGMNPQLKMPFKRYAIGRVFRDGPIKLGRYREFYQCDVDIVGTKSLLADAECIRLALAGFKRLGIPVKIMLNNRKLLEELLAKGGVPKEKALDAMLTLDKIKKVGIEDVKKELKDKNIPEESVDFIIKLSIDDCSEDEKITKIKSYLGETSGYQELIELLSYLKGAENVFFDPSLSRGLSYYTGTVFEGFVDPEKKRETKITSSVCGGGRYDTMIGGLLQRNQEYPAVGFSFGLEPIMEFLKEGGSVEKKTSAQIYIIPIKTVDESLIIAEKLREMKINVDMDLTGRSISKNLDYANSYKFPYVLIIGNQELEQKKVKFKDMNSGEESLLGLEEVANRILSGLKSAN